MKRVPSNPEDSPRRTAPNTYTSYQHALSADCYDFQLYFRIQKSTKTTISKPFRRCSKRNVSSLGKPLHLLLNDTKDCAAIPLDNEKDLQAFDIALSISHSVKLMNVPLKDLLETLQLAKKWRMGALFGWLREELERKDLRSISLSVALGILEGLPEEDYARELKGLVVGIVRYRLGEFILEPSNLEKVCLQTVCCLLEDSALHEHDKFTVAFLWVDKGAGREVHIPRLVEKMNWCDFEPGFFSDVVGPKVTIDFVTPLWIEALGKLKVKEVSYLERSIILDTSEEKELAYSHGYTFAWKCSWDLKKRELVFKVGARPELLRNKGGPFVLPVEVEMTLPDFNKTKKVSVDFCPQFPHMRVVIIKLGGNFRILNLNFKIKHRCASAIPNPSPLPTLLNCYYLTFNVVDEDTM